MNEQDINRYRAVSLEHVAKELNEAYYSALLLLCEEACTAALQLRVKEIDASATTEIYTVLCINFTKHLRQYQEQKIHTIVPYILSLSEKEKNNHNCANCNHNCKVNHAMHIALLREAHEFVKTQLHRLHNVAVPIDGGEDYNELYRLLRDKMFLLERHLLESRFIEETILIPQMLSAQKAINVHT